MMNKGKLTFYCGKMGAGKSTHANSLAQQKTCVLLSEDQWLANLYPDQITTLKDYVHYSNLLKPQIKQLVQSILISGVDVILDFPANTQKQRTWFKSIYSEINADHELIYLDVSDEICLANIKHRNIEQPERSATDTREMFFNVTKYFEEPMKEEGINIVLLNDTH